MTDTLSRPAIETRSTPPILRRRQHLALGALSATTVASVLAASPHPTTQVLVDVLLAGALSVLVVLAARRAGRASWLWIAAVATVAAGQSPLVLVAGAGLAVAFVAATRQTCPPLVGAVVAAISLSVLVRADVGDAAALGPLVGLVAIAPLLASAYRRSSRDAQHTARRVTLAILITAGVLGVASVVLLFFAVSDLDRAILSAEEGLDAARAGDRTTAHRSLVDAEKRFSGAQEMLAAPWVAPLGTLPIVQQHLDALSKVAREGADLTGSAARTAERAVVGGITVDGGAIDLSAIDAVGPPMAETAEQAATSAEAIDEIDSPWLVPPLHDLLQDHAVDLRDARDEADLAAQALAAAPRLLGAGGETTRYLVLFASPSEARELGGFVGNYAELESTDGDLLLGATGRAAQDFNAAAAAQPPVLNDPGALPERYLAYEPDTHWQNVTGTPDFPTVARTAGELYGQVTGRPVDGVLYVDPYALAGLLELTGPVHVDGLGRPLNAENAASFLLHDQYVEVPDKAERIDFLEAASRLAFERLTLGDLPAVGRVAEVLDPIVDAGRLQAYSFDPDVQALFERIGLSGAMPDADGGDLLAVVHSNANPSKIDAFLRRDVDYDVTFDASTGSVTSTATVRLHNEAPPDGLPAYVVGNGQGDAPGTNRMWLSIYTPLRVEQAQVDGVDVALELHEEYGLRRYSAFVRVPPGGTAVVTYALRGTVEPGDYRLAVASQPVANADRFSLDVTGLDGVPHATGEQTFVVEGDRRLTVP